MARIEDDGELKSLQCSQFVLKISYFKSLTSITVKLMFSDQMIILENIKTKYQVILLIIQTKSQVLVQ